MAGKTAELIIFLSILQELKCGDLVFTITPTGISAISRGDLLKASIAGLEPLNIQLI